MLRRANLWVAVRVVNGGREFIDYSTLADTKAGASEKAKIVPTASTPEHPVSRFTKVKLQEVP